MSHNQGPLVGSVNAIKLPNQAKNYHPDYHHHDHNYHDHNHDHHREHDAHHRDNIKHDDQGPLVGCSQRSSWTFPLSDP